MMMVEIMNEMNTVIGRSGLLALVMMCYILRKQGKYGVLYLILYVVLLMEMWGSGPWAGLSNWSFSRKHIHRTDESCVYRACFGTSY